MIQRIGDFGDKSCIYCKPLDTENQVHLQEAQQLLCEMTPLNAPDAN